MTIRVIGYIDVHVDVHVHVHHWLLGCLEVILAVALLPFGEGELVEGGGGGIMGRLGWVCQREGERLGVWVAVIVGIGVGGICLLVMGARPRWFRGPTPV